MNNDNAKIELNYVTFEFDWGWIKDKQIVHKGGKYGGVLMIVDMDENIVKMWGYELVSDTKP